MVAFWSALLEAEREEEGEGDGEVEGEEGGSGEGEGGAEDEVSDVGREEGEEEDMRMEGGEGVEIAEQIEAPAAAMEEERDETRVSPAPGDLLTREELIGLFRDVSPVARGSLTTVGMVSCHGDVSHVLQTHGVADVGGVS